MSEDLQATNPKAKASVSKARKAFSTILLILLTIVLAIEVRAAVGHTWSGTELADNSKNGVFAETKFEEVKGMLKLWPTEEVIREDADKGEVEYRYSWYSLLRPLLNKPTAEYFLVKKTVDGAEGVVFDIQSPNAGEIDKLYHKLGGRFEAGPGGLGGMTQRVLQENPIATPKNGAMGDDAAAAKSRPLMEDEETDEPKAEEPKTEEPKTEEPKTEEPKTEEPKTDEPKTDE